MPSIIQHVRSGALRALGLLTWRIEQIEVTSPRRIGRDGLRLGRTAPDFTLRGIGLKEVSLHDLRGKNVVILFYPLDWTPG